MSTFCNVGEIDLLGNINYDIESKDGLKDSFADIRDGSGKYIGRISMLGRVYNDFGEYVGRIEKCGHVYDNFGKYLGRRNKAEKPKHRNMPNQRSKKR